MQDHQRITDLFDRLGRIAHGLQYEAGLNPAQWEALRFLTRANRHSRSPRALAEFLCTTRGTASQTLNALEAKGYIRRTKSRADRRAVEIVLTADGLALIDKDPLCRIREATATLSAEDRTALVHAMDRLLLSLQESENRAAFGHCADCTHNCCIDAGTPIEAYRCALTGEPILIEELTHICVDFKALN